MPCYLNCVIWIKFHIYSWIPREFFNHISLNCASATRANIKQIPKICAPSRVCFWGLRLPLERLQLPWLASLSLLHSSFAKYAHLICSTCTDRLCQRIWAQLACTSAHPSSPPDGGCGRSLAMLHAQHALAIKHVRQARLMLQHALVLENGGSGGREWRMGWGWSCLQGW